MSKNKIKKLGRISYYLLILFIVSIFVIIPVSAAIFNVTVFTVANAGTSNLYEEPIITNYNNMQLVANNQMLSSGLDADVSVNNTNVPTMVTNDKTIFVAPSVYQSASNNFNYSTGNTANSSMPIIVGDGGYVTVPSNGNLHPTNSFNVVANGYYNTSGNSFGYPLLYGDASLLSGEGVIAAEITTTLTAFTINASIYDNANGMLYVGDSLGRLFQKNVGFVGNLPDTYLATGLNQIGALCIDSSSGYLFAYDQIAGKIAKIDTTTSTVVSVTQISTMSGGSLVQSGSNMIATDNAGTLFVNTWAAADGTIRSINDSTMATINTLTLAFMGGAHTVNAIDSIYYYGGYVYTTNREVVTNTEYIVKINTNLSHPVVNTLSTGKTIRRYSVASDVSNLYFIGDDGINEDIQQVNATGTALGSDLQNATDTVGGVPYSCLDYGGELYVAGYAYINRVNLGTFTQDGDYVTGTSSSSVGLTTDGTYLYLGRSLGGTDGLGEVQIVGISPFTLSSQLEWANFNVVYLQVPAVTGFYNVNFGLAGGVFSLTVGLTTVNVVCTSSLEGTGTIWTIFDMVDTASCPYMTEFAITIGGVQKLLYQPNNIIGGDVLPDLDGTQDGIISWGTNNVNLTVNSNVAPSVSVKAANNITTTTATLNGSLDSLGTATSVIVYFEYGTSQTSYSNVTVSQTLTSAPHSITSDIGTTNSPLLSGTTYYYIVVCSYSNSQTMVYSAQFNFKTNASGNIPVPNSTTQPWSAQSGSGGTNGNTIMQATQPPTWWANGSALSSLPFYGTFDNVATQINPDNPNTNPHPTTETLYLMAIMAVAAAAGYGVLLFTGSPPLAVGVMAIFAGIGASMTVVSGWMVFVILLMGLGLWFLSKFI